jgi:hypothetical protein
MGRKYYHMLFSVVLVTLPTLTMNIVMVKTLDMEAFTPLLILLYYFYFFSAGILFLAGITDPGIMERNLVKNRIKIYLTNFHFRTFITNTMKRENNILTFEFKDIFKNLLSAILVIY